MAILIPSPDVSSISGCCIKSPPKVFSNFTNPRIFKNVGVSRGSSSNSKIRAVVCSKIKDLEPRVSNLGQNVGSVFGQVKPSNTTSVKPTQEDEDKQNYYVNTGDAIRTLREEFPELFYREPSFDIYRDDIVFKDPLNTFVGIENYKSIFWALRFHGRIFFKALWVDIVSVWQPVESMIMVRWTVHGIPRVPWESRGRFDGISEYKLDKNGKIFEHRVHNIALNSPPKFHMLSVSELIQSLGCPSTPKPTYFEFSSSPTSENLPLSVTSSGFNHYLTSVMEAKEESSQRN